MQKGNDFKLGAAMGSFKNKKTVNEDAAAS